MPMAASDGLSSKQKEVPHRNMLKSVGLPRTDLTKVHNCTWVMETKQ